MIMRLLYPFLAVGLILQRCNAFGVATCPSFYRLSSWCRSQAVPAVVLHMSVNDDVSESAPVSSSTTTSSTSEEEEEAIRKQAIGNLVADDEWMGLSMELSELVRLAVVEDLKKNVRDFIGKEDYKIGDLSKEVDTRVKGEIARIRNKDDYELFDLAKAADELSKNFTQQLTGKPYEAGDLSIEVDKRVKAKVAEFCGKEDYELGDLTLEVDKRVRQRVEEFTSKPYEFGDISKEVESRRRQWVSDYLGEEAAKNYQFGDITKKAITQFTGKEEYQFGDITKKLVGDFFGPRKKGGSADK